MAEHFRTADIMDGFRELSPAEINFVAGGFNGHDFWTGAAIFGGGLIAVAALPVEAPVALGVGAVAGAALVGSAAGYYIGSGIRG